MERGGIISLLAMLSRRLVVRLMVVCCVRMLGACYLNTWCLERSVSLLVFRCRRTGSLIVERGRRRSVGVGVVEDCRASRRRGALGGGLRGCWVLRGLGLRTSFLRLVATASSRSSW